MTQAAPASGLQLTPAEAPPEAAHLGILAVVDLYGGDMVSTGLW